MKKLTPRQKRVLDYVEQYSLSSVPEIADGLDEPPSSIRTAVKRLEYYRAIYPRGITSTGARCYDLEPEQP